MTAERSLFTDVAIRFVGGLATGAGFMIAAIAVAYAATRLWPDPMMAGPGEDDVVLSGPMFAGHAPQKYSDDARLEIIDDRVVRIPDGARILGELRNLGDATWSSVRLEAELFDAEGTFVGECSEYVSETLRPGDHSNVQIDCGGCERNPFPEFSTYTVKVIDAHNY